MSKLNTPNLELKVKSLQDVDALLAVSPNQADRDSIVKSVFLSDAHWRKNGFGPWSIYLTSSKKLIGSVSLRKNPANEIEFAVEIEAGSRKKGFAKEAAKAVFEFAFKLHKIERIVASIRQNDTAALKCLTSLGFKLDGNGDSELVKYVLSNPSL